MNGKDFSNFGVIGRIVEDLDFQNLYFDLSTSFFFFFWLRKRTANFIK